MPMPMTGRKLLPPNLTIGEMLKRKSFEQLLEDHDIYDVDAAAPLMGFHPMHVRWLCRKGKIERIEVPDRKQRWYLYARTVHGAAPKHVAPSARRPS